MADIGKQTGGTRGRPAPVTPAPTRSQVNRENKAPGADQTAKPPPDAARPAAKPPPEPSKTVPKKEPDYGWRRGDQQWIPVQAPEVEPSHREEGEGVRPKPQDDPGQRRRQTPRIPAVAAQIALALICVVTEPAVHERRNESDANIPLQAQPEPQTGPPQVLNPSSAQTVVAMDAEAALTAALDDLGSALEAQPERSPEELLRQVSTPDHDCMLAWHDHVPSLIFGKQPIEPNSLANSIHACANAVRRLR